MKSKNQKKAVCDDVEGWYFNINFFCTASVAAVKTCARAWRARAGIALRKEKKSYF